MIGLTFIALSLMAGRLTDENRLGLRVYTSPVSLHFSCVLLVSLIALSPLRPAVVFGLLTALGALLLIHAIWVLFHLPEMEVADAEDICWYGVAPLAAHVALLAGAVLPHFGVRGGPITIAVATSALLLVAIRNAWDLMVWAVLRASRESKES